MDAANSWPRAPYWGGQSFGASDASNVGGFENAINMCGCGRLGSPRHNNPIPSTLGGNGYGPSLFRNPQAVYNCFRNPILGIDPGPNGGVGTLRGQPFWNVDFSVKKNRNDHRAGERGVRCDLHEHL